MEKVSPQLTTYDGYFEEYYVTLPWGEKMLNTLREKEKTDIAVIAKPYYAGFGYHVWTYTYYANRIIPDDLIA